MVRTFHAPMRILVLGPSRPSFALLTSFRLSSEVVILPPKEFGWLGSTMGLMSIGFLILVSVTIGFFLQGGVVSATPNPQPGGPGAAFCLTPHPRPVWYD